MQQQIQSTEDFKKFFENYRENLKQSILEQTQEIIDSELDLLEFNLFISSFGKDLKQATKDVQELRKKVDSGEIDLAEYEEMAEEF